jgi:uncharacterized membrane protein YfcA
VAGLTVRALLLLFFVLAVMTFCGLLLGWLPARLLPERALLLFYGFLLGFTSALALSARLRRKEMLAASPLSSALQAVAIEKLQSENPGMTNEEAEDRIAAIRRGEK